MEYGKANKQGNDKTTIEYLQDRLPSVFVQIAMCGECDRARGDICHRIEHSPNRLMGLDY